MGERLKKLQAHLIEVRDNLYQVEDWAFGHWTKRMGTLRDMRLELAKAHGGLDLAITVAGEMTRPTNGHTMPFLQAFSDDDADRLAEAFARILNARGGDIDHCAVVVEAVERYANECECPTAVLRRGARGRWTKGGTG